MTDINLFMNTIGAIGSFLTGIAAIVGILKYFKTIKFKEESYFGGEAQARYESLKDILPKESSFEYLHGGGAILTPRFEVKKFVYDPQTMIPQWKGYKKLVRYYFKNKDGENTVRGWRLK